MPCAQWSPVDFGNILSSLRNRRTNTSNVAQTDNRPRTPIASMKILNRLRSGLRAMSLRDFSCAAAACPFCGPSVFVRLNRSGSGIRCLRCAASTVHLSIGLVLRDIDADLSNLDVCEFSAHGPFADYLRKHAHSLALSEFHADAEPGSINHGTRHEDVQHLSYPDRRFDLVTHTEVLEHVPDDQRAFAELYRVIKPGGLMVFTVPLSSRPDTVERARLCDGQIEHLLPAVHHLDPWQKGIGILAYRDYGSDIEGRMRDAGFSDITIRRPQHRIPWLQACAVITARVARHE